MLLASWIIWQAAAAKDADEHVTRRERPSHCAESEKKSGLQRKWRSPGADGCTDHWEGLAADRQNSLWEATGRRQNLEEPAHLHDWAGRRGAVRAHCAKTRAAVRRAQTGGCCYGLWGRH